VRRYILTGAPGSGKTSISRILAARGYPVVEEAATDVISAEQAAGIAEPWRDPVFIDKIIELQRSRQLAQPDLRDQPGNDAGLVAFHDRSPICTLALATYSGYQPSPVLQAEVDRVLGEGIYQREVFLVRPIGFIERTAARRIGYADSLRFEQIHEAIYARLNFLLIDVNPGPPQDRADFICEYLDGGLD
jgi:predicted ATPase